MGPVHLVHHSRPKLEVATCTERLVRPRHVTGLLGCGDGTLDLFPLAKALHAASEELLAQVPLPELVFVKDVSTLDG